jgi:peptide/nickel transport system ATP-binding protein
MHSDELQVKNLKVAFSSPKGDLIAVNGISFQIEKGETLALVGESGCGKTVSALSILRLIPEPPGKVLGGEICLGDRDLLRLSPKEMRDLRGNEIAMIFQDPLASLNPVLTIGEQIIETLLRHTKIPRAEASKRTEELLRRVEIPSPSQKMKNYPHHLSGGMLQRVMIAMTLSCSPKILIADEPTTALDVLIQLQILDLLKQLKEETGMSILLITHDLGVVRAVAQRVLVMYAGDIVEVSPMHALMETPLHPYTQGLIESLPSKSASKNRARLPAIPGVVPSLGQRPGGCPFHPRCAKVESRCRDEFPELKELESGRWARCFVAERDR